MIVLWLWALWTAAVRGKQVFYFTMDGEAPLCEGGCDATLIGSARGERGGARIDERGSHVRIPSLALDAPRGRLLDFTFAMVRPFFEPCVSTNLLDFFFFFLCCVRFARVRCTAHIPVVVQAIAV